MSVFDAALDASDLPANKKVEWQLYLLAQSLNLSLPPANSFLWAPEK